MPTASAKTEELPELLRGNPETLATWAHEWEGRRALGYLAVVVVGTGLFGAAMGWWRSPAQAGFNALKLPLVLLVTTLGNALLNGMLAPLLGANLHLRQSLMLVLMSFTIAGLILGAFAPLIAFIVWNTPPLEAGRAQNSTSFAFIQLSIVAIVAFAGVAANVRLAQLLRRLSGDAGVARRILLGWLAGNLLLGSQLSWILRPFIGSPDLPVEFLRKNAFDGNLFETIARAVTHFFR